MCTYVCTAPAAPHMHSLTPDPNGSRCHPRGRPAFPSPGAAWFGDAPFQSARLALELLGGGATVLSREIAATIFVAASAGTTHLPLYGLCYVSSPSASVDKAGAALQLDLTRKSQFHALYLPLPLVEGMRSIRLRDFCDAAHVQAPSAQQPVGPNFKCFASLCHSLNACVVFTTETSALQHMP